MKSLTKIVKQNLDKEWNTYLNKHFKNMKSPKSCEDLKKKEVLNIK